MTKTVRPRVRERSFRGRVVSAAAIALLIAACGGDGDETEESASPEDDSAAVGAEFYDSSDTLEMIISWSPGGGTDTIGRLMAPFLADHIDGSPSLQVVNVEGGGGIQGHNEFALRREADGSNMLFSAGSSKVAYLLDEPGVQFDFRDMQPILGVPAGAVIYANPNAGIEGIDDLINPTEPLRFGSIGAASTDAIVLLAFDVLDLDVQTTFGYEGSGAIRVAFEQGEVNINRDGTIGYLGNVEPLVEEGSAVPLFTFGQIQEGEVVRDPAFPDMPTISEVHEELYGEPPSGGNWETFKAVSSALFTLEKVLWLQEGAPDEALQTLRDAGTNLAQDEEFRERGEDIFGPYELIVGDDIDAAVNEMLTALSDDVRRDFVDFLVENYDLEPR